MSNLVTPKNKTESYRIFDNIAKTYDFLNIILSLGIDRLWRRKLLKIIGEKNKVNKALDLATGTADMAILLGKSKNVESVLGLDMSQKMINIGNDKIDRSKLQNKVKLGIGNGMELPLESGSKDLITITFGIRNFGDYEKGLKEMYRVLETDGRCIIMEFSIPKNFLVRTVYFFYFRNLLPLIGNFISGNKMAYTYLNETVEDFPYGERFASKLKEQGFTEVKVHPLTFGIASIYEAKK